MIRLQPTELGYKALGFYALLLVAFFAAPYANLLFFLLAFLTVLGLFSILWTLRNVRGLQAAVGELPALPAGREARVPVSLGDPRRPRWALELVLEFEDGLRCRVPLEPAVSGADCWCPLPPLPRGIHRLRRARLTSGWPLGVLRASTAVATPAEIVVYPEPAERAGTAPGGGGEDPCALRAAAQGALQPSALRAYRPGDEPRRVHWKASARRAALVVAEWEAGRGSGYEVVLDRRGDAATLEEHLRRVVSLALEAQTEKEPLTLHTQGLSRSFSSGQSGFQALWRFLAGAAALPAGAPPPPSASPDALVLRGRLP